MRPRLEGDRANELDKHDPQQQLQEEARQKAHRGKGKCSCIFIYFVHNKKAIHESFSNPSFLQRHKSSMPKVGTTRGSISKKSNGGKQKRSATGHLHPKSAEAHTGGGDAEWDGNNTQ